LKKLIIWIIVIAAIILSIAIAKYIISNKKSEVVKTDSNTQTISLQNGNPTLDYVVKRREMGDSISLIGSVEAKIRNVRPKVSGEITQIYVKEGDTVKKGEALAKIDDTQYRYQYLHALNAYNNSLTGASSLIEEAKLSLKLAKENLDNTEIKSPISGTIKNINVSVGDMVGQNSNILTIVNNSDIKIDANINEIDLPKVKVGEKVRVVFDKLNNINMSGHISFISPSAVNSGGLTVIPIEVSLDENPSKEIINGLNCTVNISLMKSRNVITVPNIAIKEDKKGSYVFVKDNNVAKKVYIKVGQKTQRMAEVISGLKEGDVIVIELTKGNIENRIPGRIPGSKGLYPPKSR
jgi:multidrug efflux pump subunit AcrA (membrane-fusion protein)